MTPGAGWDNGMSPRAEGLRPVARYPQSIRYLGATGRFCKTLLLHKFLQSSYNGMSFRPEGLQTIRVT
jgi:hypothetical protein